MNLFDQLLGTIRGVMDGYDLQPSRQLGHEEFCLCHRCVFVRGVRGELAAFAKAEAKAEKKRGGAGPTFDDILYGPAVPRFRKKRAK